MYGCILRLFSDFVSWFVRHSHEVLEHKAKSKQAGPGSKSTALSQSFDASHNGGCKTAVYSQLRDGIDISHACYLNERIAHQYPFCYDIMDYMIM